jgi:hypothetical protein
MKLQIPTTDSLWMAAGAAIAFGLSFRINQLFDGLFVYAPGMSLLFLPAGVKLLFVLVGRIPAICGIMAVSVYLGYGIWPDKSLGAVITFAFIGLITYPISAYLIMRWLGVRQDLTNLRYGHIVVLSLAASMTNGVLHNILYMVEEVTTSDDFWVKAAAMTLGDFIGCFVVVALFQLAISYLRHLGTVKK